MRLFSHEIEYTPAASTERLRHDVQLLDTPISLDYEIADLYGIVAGHAMLAKVVVPQINSSLEADYLSTFYILQTTQDQTPKLTHASIQNNPQNLPGSLLAGYGSLVVTNRETLDTLLTLSSLNEREYDVAHEIEVDNLIARYIKPGDQATEIKGTLQVFTDGDTANFIQVTIARIGFSDSGVPFIQNDVGPGVDLTCIRSASNMTS